MRGTEQKTYREQYSNDVDKVFAQVHQTLDLTLNEIDSYVVNLVAYTVNSNNNNNNDTTTWPYVTIPYFAVQAAKIRGLTKGFLVSIYHKITDDMSEPWENYTAANDGWVNESLKIQLEDPTFLGIDIESYSGPPSRLNLSPDPPLDQQGNNMYFPKWQSSPVVPFWDPYNWDLNRLDNFYDTVLPEILQHHAVISPAPNVPVNDSPEAQESAQANIDWFSLLLDADRQDPASPVSDLFYPILSHAASDVVLKNATTSGRKDDSQLLGIFSLSFFWKDLFANILPTGSDGMVTVVSNTCGQDITFELNGPEVILMGITDLHDSRYTNMQRSTSLHIDPSETTTALPLGNDLCTFTLAAYPSQRLESRFYSSDPIVFCIAVVSTFLVSAIIFLLYDFLVEARQRAVQHNEWRAANEAEKSKLIVDNARQATRAERELNDFIAHEVRNPVSAAMAACSFVKSAVNDSNKQPLDAETLQTVREDVQVIDCSLNFVADLLRNMLDMHRAADKKMKIHLEPVDILHDILEPTGGMLYRRREDKKVQLYMECHPPNLVVETDRLRLQQVILNLGRNSSKFISKGYIRLRAGISSDDGSVELSVEDSGCGVPVEKRALLFSKFQDSLDVLSQGTGIGLFLCKNLVGLMQGEIALDEDFDSGIEGCPGTRIVIRLNKKPSNVLDLVGQNEQEDDGQNGETQKAWRPVTDENGDDDDNKMTTLQQQHDLSSGGPPLLLTGTTTARDNTLPEKQRVLFVDDDAMLRKLFSRSIQRAAPTWTCQEAGNGEAALMLTETEEFDIIFMDMYMSSVEKQLLGTETVGELRSRGVSCHIFGLSANDKEEEFLKAGADGFLFKPFPCKTDLLRAELGHLLSQRHPSFSKKNDG